MLSKRWQEGDTLFQLIIRSTWQKDSHLLGGGSAAAISNALAGTGQAWAQILGPQSSMPTVALPKTRAKQALTHSPG